MTPLRRWLATLPVAAVVLSGWQAAKAPEQPIPYSHRTHIALGLECRNCHTNPDPGEVMGIPKASVCMGCHQTVKKDSPHIQKLATFAQSRREIPWVRVYQIPAYVRFSHREHLATGATCATCHGEVKTRDVLWREANIHMGGCMECHLKNQASNDCSFCHEPK
ncbi:MAG: cytochrome c3 family protein [Acidobacteria bacterium]|nr:cytochrome c3 family protein [Acidobacteriota bacterium]